jgi:hypothetical protein
MNDESAEKRKITDNFYVFSIDSKEKKIKYC